MKWCLNTSCLPWNSNSGVFTPTKDEQSVQKVEDSDNNVPKEATVEVGILQRFLLDWRSISLLLFFYTLQGLPLGLQGSVPLIIQSHNVTYNEQAAFSLSGWPFSLKLVCTYL